MRESLLRNFRNTETEHRTPLPREAIQGLLSSALAIGGAAGTTDTARWYRLALALLIVDVTGERIGAVRQLRRDDLKFAKRGMSRELEIRYRAETTKANRTRKVVLPPRETELAHQILNEIPVIGHGLLFPAASGHAPATTDTFIADLKALAAQAGVDLPPNSKWHGARARWATDRRHLDPHATMKAGGWSDYETFARYIHLTEDDIRTAIAAPRSDVILPSFDGTLKGHEEPQPPASERPRLKLER